MECSTLIIHLADQLHRPDQQPTKRLHGQNNETQVTGSGSYHNLSQGSAIQISE